VGLEASETALRLERPNLASGALDAAASAAISRGLYNRQLPIQERRLPLVPRLSDPLEIGDTYSAIVWSLFEIGRFDEAARLASIGLEDIRGRATNVEIHALAWRSIARYRLGMWDDALSDFAEIQTRLDDRREDPPYFASHAFAGAALIHEARGESLEVDRMLGYLIPLAESRHARFVPWLGRLMIERGQLDEAHRLLDTPPDRWKVHAGDLLETRLELIAADRAFDRASAVLQEARDHAAEAGLVALPLFADRLEGLLAVDRGDATVGIELLERASAGLAKLGATWERARTELALGRVLRAEGRAEDARRVLGDALVTFEELGAIARAREASAELG
jgi:tetratricopeptide (TPR) repeat protein